MADVHPVGQDDQRASHVPLPPPHASIPGQVRPEPADTWPSRRVRFRQKRHELLDHRSALPPEPRLREHELQDVRDDQNDADTVGELVPELHHRAPIKKPKSSEVLAHEVTHVPYKPWCQICVKGRGLEKPHRQSDDHDVLREDQIPKMTFDWAHFRDRDGGPTVPVLVGLDQKSGHRTAVLTTDRVASNPDTVSHVVTSIQREGHHGPLEIRTDGEPALVDLMNHVAAKRTSPTLLRRSRPYDSQANGRVERTVRSVEEVARVHKLDLESRVCRQIRVQEPIFAWLLRASVALLN